MKFIIPKEQKKEPNIFKIAAISAGMVLAVLGIAALIKKMMENGCCLCGCHDSCDCDEDGCDCGCEEDESCTCDCGCDTAGTEKKDTVIGEIKDKADDLADTVKNTAKKAADKAKDIFDK